MGKLYLTLASKSLKQQAKEAVAELREETYVLNAKAGIMVYLKSYKDERSKLRGRDLVLYKWGLEIGMWDSRETMETMTVEELKNALDTRSTKDSKN